MLPKNEDGWKAPLARTVTGPTAQETKKLVTGPVTLDMLEHPSALLSIPDGILCKKLPTYGECKEGYEPGTTKRRDKIAETKVKVRIQNVVDEAFKNAKQAECYAALHGGVAQFISGCKLGAQNDMKAPQIHS